MRKGLLQLESNKDIREAIDVQICIPRPSLIWMGKKGVCDPDDLIIEQRLQSLDLDILVAGVGLLGLCELTKVSEEGAA